MTTTLAHPNVLPVTRPPLSTPTVGNAPRLALSIAASAAEVREAQALRYRVFIEHGGLHALANPSRLDEDEFDVFCDHLIVRDTSTGGTGAIVGTYRLLNPVAARQLGRVYCDGEFDLGNLQALRHRIVEAGRACIDPDYRSGAVIMLLWAGLAGYMKQHNCDFLAGCASIGLESGNASVLALTHQLAETHLAPASYRVTPHRPLTSSDDSAKPAAVPPLLRGYLRSGAWICGMPAHDPEFNCADLFVLLPLSNLDERYAKRYLDR